MTLPLINIMGVLLYKLFGETAQPKPLYTRTFILYIMASITIEKVTKGFVATNHDVDINAFGLTKEDAFKNLESNVMYKNMLGVKNV